MTTLTPEQIIEGNGIIAKFMGRRRKDGMWFFDEPMPFTMAYEANLLFHSSWDWLIPVVEKIEKTQSKNLKSWCQNSFSVRIQGNTAYVMGGDLGLTEYSEFHQFGGATKIEAVWLACVDFIKWYNNNKKKS